MLLVKFWESLKGRCTWKIQVIIKYRWNKGKVDNFTFKKNFDLINLIVSINWLISKISKTVNGIHGKWLSKVTIDLIWFNFILNWKYRGLRK